MQQEIRFALVMYGGVSLAVYMNGVTQEFLHLVRATSAGLAGSEPAGTEAVYRELARIANARFVVDILSGSSAGGINALFLGKALANGQSLDELSRLWIEEADLGCLWNGSVRPRSLLSGHAMYGMLLRALDSMDAVEGSGRLQSEADVFLTTTDIQGLELPLPLADGAVTEKRHKNVFHFRFAQDGRDDFTREQNRFLAFAARATSSFPLAFEPARLADYSICEESARFFPDYIAAHADYARRAFGDGGYLNNKPFNYALDEIPRRVSDLPIRRLLIYIEPAPEQATGNTVERAPGPLGNSIEALITLHQYETIREDLRQVLERNALVERVREATAQVDRDVERWRGGAAALRLPGPDHARRTLAQEVHDRGPGYAGYHRLKVRAVTGDLAKMTGRPQAEVEAWRAANYREEDSASSENLFLLHFDLGYRQRRLRLLIARLDEAGGPPELRAELARIARSLANPALTGLDWDAVRETLRSILIPAAREAERILRGHMIEDRHPLQRCFDRYEDYDQVTFPILYETQVGEAEPVEVFRVSPLDARSLIDEPAPGEPRRKLAGTAVFHFGAFLKRGWRVNDLMWGRLDGAERVIQAVLKDSPDTARLIREAQLAILRESFGEQAPAVLEHLRTSYEVDRRLGWCVSLRNILKLLWISSKMLLAALIR